MRNLDGMPATLLIAKIMDAILTSYPNALLKSGPKVVGMATVRGFMRFTTNRSVKVGFLNALHPTGSVMRFWHSRGGCAR
jgi:hypothetical protein